MSRFIRTLLFIILLPLFCHLPALAEDFALRDGDTVVFLGDSITAAQSYGKTIENYTLLRYPSHQCGAGG